MIVTQMKMFDAVLTSELLVMPFEQTPKWLQDGYIEESMFRSVAGGRGSCKTWFVHERETCSIQVFTDDEFKALFQIESLTFDDLRAANIKRIPLFKNRKGVVVHKPDGSDLSVAEWFRNLMGEMGEFAGWHKKWQLGEIDESTYKKESAKELADIQTYLDILAYRVGVDLGEATRQKFNEVSERFNCEVRL